jgi:hypothetical protein
MIPNRSGEIRTSKGSTEEERRAKAKEEIDAENAKGDEGRERGRRWTPSLPLR